MSEFSTYLLTRESVADVVERVTGQGVTALVLPNKGPWSVIVCKERDDLVTQPFPCLLRYDYAEDHGFSLELFAGGKPLGKLSAASEVKRHWRFEAQPWVAHKVLTAPAADKLVALLESEDWDHEAVRDQVAAVVGFRAEAWLAYRYLERDGFDTGERYPGAVWVDRPKPPAAAAPKPKKGAKPDRLAMSREELKEISDAFRGAAAVVAPQPKGSAAHVDLARCSTSREWLDAKKLIDPKIASDELVAELERTVRDGRFAEEGDRATVVREAAAMLLGRWLASRDFDKAAWLDVRVRAATTREERAAWQVVVSVISPKR